MFRTIRTIFLILWLAPQLIWAEDSRVLSSSVDLRPQRNLAEVESRVKLITLDNGLRVILYQRGEAPVFAGSLVVRVGGVDEPLGMSGISHMFEHMAFKGTPNIGTKDYGKERGLLKSLEVLRTKEAEQGKLSEEELGSLRNLESSLKQLWKSNELSEEIERRGGVELNAQTTTEATTYHVELPSSQLEFFCRLESDRIMQPVLREFYQERDVVLEERRMRIDTSPEGMLYEKLLDGAYKVHPYRRPVIGYEHEIRRLTATMTEDFRKKYYVPSNIVVSLVGALDPETVIPIVQKYFGRIPPATAPSKPDIVEPRQNQERRVFVSGDFAPQLAVAYHKVQYPHPDGAALTAALSTIATSKSSWLYDKLVTKERLASEVSLFTFPGNMYPDLATFWLTPLAPHKNREVLKRFDEIIEDFKNSGPTLEQLEHVKRRLQISLLERFAHNLSLATDLAENEALYGDWRATLNEYDQIVKLQVSDLQRVADKYFVKTERTLGFIDRKAP